MIDATKKEISISGGTAPGEIGNLTAHFILPGAGSFGRDKSVPFGSATHAAVSYTRDRSVVEQTVTVTEAVALVEQAQKDGEAAAARSAAAREHEQAAIEETKHELAELACPICGCREFDEQIGREDSQWGVTTLRMKLLICRRCAYVLQFALGRSMFVPG